MNKNQLENTVLSLLFVAGLILVAMFTKSGAYFFVANIFATDIYIQAALLVLVLLVGYSLISKEERYIISQIPKSAVAGITALTFLLLVGSTVLPDFSKETGLALLKIVGSLLILATITFLFSFTIKENNESCSKSCRTKPPTSSSV